MNIVFEIPVGKMKVVPSWKDILTAQIICHMAFLSALLKQYLNNIVLFELAALALCIAYMARKKARFVYYISFDDAHNICTVKYKQFQFLKFKTEIKYEELDFKYTHIMFYRGQIPLTLRIIKNGKIIADIREKYNLGFSNEEIQEMKTYVEQIKKSVK
ncbi:hypothetical protein [Chitinophaga rhizosphaerae]|uniref:hypothetical protein n=1 Tax=Chitinophaga rhizosphaerae TaxID=1864947 RepID=UPI000F80FA16|nr:hypothetical protein [Chitinophaga rhizosphaerae]